MTQRDKIVLFMKDDKWHGSNELQRIAWQFHSRQFELINDYHLTFEKRDKYNKKGAFIYKEYKLIKDDKYFEYISNLNK